MQQNPPGAGFGGSSSAQTRPLAGPPLASHDQPGLRETGGNASALQAPSAGRRLWLLDRAPTLTALLMLAVIIVIYGSLQRGVFSLTELNMDSAAAMTLIFVATGQTLVLIRGGVDLSVGGMVSLGTCLAATRFTDDPAHVALWSGLILALGFGIGALNGLLISALKLQPFVVTLASWSMLSGTAMLILPTDGGRVPGWWVNFGYADFFGIGSAVWILAGLLLFWSWLRRSRLGLAIKSAGSSERSAYLSGVPILRVNMLTYGLSGCFAAAGALFLTTQTGAGSPTIGKDYILPSVAAAVIGGVSLFGGRGHLIGTVIGAFILTLIGNLVFVLGISSYWQPVMSGSILLAAVLASALAEKTARGQEQ